MGVTTHPMVADQVVRLDRGDPFDQIGSLAFGPYHGEVELGILFVLLVAINGVANWARGS